MARSSIRFSSAVKAVFAFREMPNCSGPMATRTNRRHSTPKLSIMRRIWRFLAFIEDDLEPAVFCPRAAGELASLAALPRLSLSRPHQGLNEVSSANGSDLHMIGLIQMRFRRGDARAPLGIVGQQQQTFTGFVEAADWGNRLLGMKAAPNMHSIFRVHRLAALSRPMPWSPAARLVHHEIDFLSAR
jgi:hypothetical protein